MPGAAKRKLPLLLALLACSLAVAQRAAPVLPIAPGVTYTQERLSDGPWEIRIVRVERGARYIHLDSALGMGQLKGVERISGIVRREDTSADTVVAGVNADFFTMAGNPRAGMVSGLEVRHGELVTTARGRPSFVLLQDGTPLIGVFDTTGTVTTAAGELPAAAVNEGTPAKGVGLYTPAYGWSVADGCAVVKVDDLPLRPNGIWRGKITEIVPPGTAREAAEGEVLLCGVSGPAVGSPVEITLRTPGLPGPVEAAVGGNVVLLRGGKDLYPDEGADPRHPRTLVGFSEREIVLVTVDGRQVGWSIGMRYHELSALMRRLGCTDAMNLDGGGSTTAWVRGKIVNRPSDGGERLIANALLVKSRAPHGPLARLSVLPASLTALAGATVPLDLRPTDEWYNPVSLKPGDLSVDVVGERGRRSSVAAQLVDGTLALSGKPGRARVRFSIAGRPEALAEVPVRLVGRCARVAVTPPMVATCLGEAFTLGAEGLGRDGAVIWAPPSAARWEVAGNGLRSLGGGRFEAAAPGSATTVRASIGPASGQATVQVARSFTVEGFEAAADPVASIFPEKGPVRARAAILATGAVQGAHFARLTYDLVAPKGTRAAYLPIDRFLGAPLRLSLLARGTATRPAWLRVALIDGNGSRQTYTIADAVSWSRDWRRVYARLPDGIKPPVRWESVYVVALDGATGAGSVDIDDLQVERVGE